MKQRGERKYELFFQRSSRFAKMAFWKKQLSCVRAQFRPITTVKLSLFLAEYKDDASTFYMSLEFR